MDFRVQTGEGQQSAIRGSVATVIILQMVEPGSGVSGDVGGFGHVTEQSSVR